MGPKVVPWGMPIHRAMTNNCGAKRHHGCDRPIKTL